MEIVTLNVLEVVGIRVKADWKGLHVKMPAAWKEFSKRLDEIPNRKNNVMMDVSLEAAEGIYTQLIGVEISGQGAIPDGMDLINIPRQQYLYHRHEGSLKDIAISFGEMYDWAKGQGVSLGEFKLDMGYTAEGDENIHDLYIRIAGS